MLLLPLELSQVAKFGIYLQICVYTQKLKNLQLIRKRIVLLSAGDLFTWHTNIQLNWLTIYALCALSCQLNENMKETYNNILLTPKQIKKKTIKEL